MKSRVGPPHCVHAAEGAGVCATSERVAATVKVRTRQQRVGGISLSTLHHPRLAAPMGTVSASWISPSQAPQSLRREDDGNTCHHAERQLSKDPEQHSVGVGDPAADKPGPPHMRERDHGAKERPEEHQDVAGSPPGERQRSVQPDRHRENRLNVFNPPGSNPRTTSSDTWSMTKRIESRDVTTRTLFCFIRSIVAARARSNNPHATKRGFARTNGGLAHATSAGTDAGSCGSPAELAPTLQVNLRRFIVMALHMADRAQIHDDRSMDLRE